MGLQKQTLPPRSRSDTCSVSGRSPGCSHIPGEGTRGLPSEDGEAALGGFVFLFRPPGLATAADGAGWARDSLLSLDSLQRCENAHPEGARPPRRQRLRGGESLMLSQHRAPDAPVVPGVCSCPLLQFHRALHANLQLFIHQPRLFSCLRVPSDTAHPCTQPLMLHTVPGALSAANKYLIVCQLYLNKNGYDEVIPN